MDGLTQVYINFIANALELLLSYAKPSKCILNHASTYI